VSTFGVPADSRSSRAADHEPHAFRNLQLVNLQVGFPATARVEQPAFLRQVREHLLDEERIALRLLKDGRHQLRGRRRASERRE